MDARSQSKVCLAWLEFAGCFQGGDLSTFDNVVFWHLVKLYVERGERGAKGAIMIKRS